jgi:hypothetical protein
MSRRAEQGGDGQAGFHHAPSSASLTSQADLGKSVFVLEGGMN